MQLLAALDQAESDALWWQLIKATTQVNTEIGLLERIPPDVRHLLYGESVLEHYTGLRDELLSIVTDDLDAPSGPDPLTT